MPFQPDAVGMILLTRLTIFVNGSPEDGKPDPIMPPCGRCQIRSAEERRDQGSHGHGPSKCGGRRGGTGDRFADIFHHESSLAPKIVVVPVVRELMILGGQ